MSAKRFDAAVQKYKNCLCVGLDIAPENTPPSMRMDNYLNELENLLVDIPAIKINFAFFEHYFNKSRFQKAVEHARSAEIGSIADAKRCDVASSAEYYSQEILGNMGFDAITVSPYMGLDSLTPFLAPKDKLTFVLALTSNPGAGDFQFHPYSSLEDALVGYQIKGLEEPLFVKVVKKVYAHAQNYPGDVGFVVGATRPEAVGLIRSLAPDAYILVPGVGAQGGSLEAVLEQTSRRILINVSRDILRAYQNVDLSRYSDAYHPEMRAIEDKIHEYRARMRPYFD
jgi:orotidine-5'-phosphate decarboxylase